MSEALAPLAAGLMDWLDTSALPLWWTGGARAASHEALDKSDQPVAANRRARVQARQVYVYATAGDLGWGGVGRGVRK